MGMLYKTFTSGLAPFSPCWRCGVSSHVGEVHVARNCRQPLWGSNQEPARTRPQSIASRKWVLPANYSVTLEVNFFPNSVSKWEPHPGDTLIAALWNSTQGILLSYAWTSDSWNHEIMNVCCFKHCVCFNVLCSSRKQIQITLDKPFPSLNGTYLSGAMDSIMWIIESIASVV